MEMMKNQCNYLTARALITKECVKRDCFIDSEDIKDLAKYFLKTSKKPEEIVQRIIDGNYDHDLSIGDNANEWLAE